MQQGPMLVRIGTRLLATWLDSRGHRIYGTWLENGVPVDPMGFPITSTTAVGSAQTGGNGRGAIIAWSGSDRVLRASWMAADGTLFNSDGVLVNPETRYGYAVATASGARSLIAYDAPSAEARDFSRVFVRLASFGALPPIDAGVLDAAAPDAVEDAATPDTAIVVSDAGSTDSALLEASTEDATPPESGPAGPGEHDAGMLGSAKGGCSCRTESARSARNRAFIDGLLLAGLTLLLRRGGRVQMSRRVLIPPLASDVHTLRELAD
jgi:hypothetical protein